MIFTRSCALNGKIDRDKTVITFKSRVTAIQFEKKVMLVVVQTCFKCLTFQIVLRHIDCTLLAIKKKFYLNVFSVNSINSHRMSGELLEMHRFMKAVHDQLLKFITRRCYFKLQKAHTCRGEQLNFQLTHRLNAKVTVAMNLFPSFQNLKSFLFEMKMSIFYLFSSHHVHPRRT